MVLINQKDCDTTRKNLGLSDCILQEGRLTGFIITPKGWNIDLESDTFDKDYVNDQIQQGNFVPVLGATEAVSNTPEATTQEFQGGVKVVVRNGLPEYTFTFVKGGWKFASALYTYNSQQAFDVLFVFSSGAIAGATNGTTFTGFDLGMLNTGTYMFTDGSTSSNVKVSMQLMNEVQFNRDVALLDASSLDFNVNSDILPITDIVITGRADVADDNKIYAKFAFATNEASLLSGLASANLKVYTDGVANPISGAIAYNTTTKEWAITLTNAFVLGQTSTIQLYDAVNSVACAKIGSRYYSGTSKAIAGLYD